MKQGTTHRPTSHLVHCAFFWLLKAHRQQHTCVDDFAGQCLLWTSSSKTFFAPTLGLITNLGVGWSWLFAASSIWFLTRSSLKSLSVHLAPHADNSIQLLSAVRSRRWKYNFMFHLLLDWQKDGYLCSFLEVVPRLGISHLLQPVVWLCWGLQLLLLVFSSSPLPPSSSSSSKFPVGVSNQNFLKFYFFPSHCSRPTAVCLV